MRLKAVVRGTLHSLRSITNLQWYFRNSKIVRGQKLTLDGYEVSWGRDINLLRQQNLRLMVLDGYFVYATTLDLDFKFVGEHYAAIIERYPDNQAIKILDVGAGYGRMALPLAVLLPKAEITAIEYGKSGPINSQAYERGFLDQIKTIANTVGKFHPKPSPLVERFISGDAKSMPFDDGEFDVSYTNVVLEQIPMREDSLKILKEMRRVTRDYCCFLEPWSEAQNVLTKGYLKSIDYFRHSQKLLEEAGFSEIEYKTLDYHHNLKYKLGYLVAKV